MKKHSLPISQPKKRTLVDDSDQNAERRHAKRRVSDTDQNHTYLGEKVRQQEGQIKEWADKEKLAEEQVYIRTKAMDATSDGIFIVDARVPNFPVVYTNPSFEHMTGYAKKDILGKNYFLVYGADADPRIAEEIKDTLRHDTSFYGEMLNFRKNGDKFWNHLRITPVRDSAGVVTHYVGIQTDMTAMRQRDLEIKEQREELLHVTRVGKLAEFVSSLAHEISQPLTAILSYAQAAQRMLVARQGQGTTDQQLQEILQYIITDDQRAAEVIRRLRSLLKKSTPEFEFLDINVLVKETMVLIATDVAVRHKALHTELATGLPMIYGDRIQLQQVLLNLVSNSLDAMEGNDSFHDLLIRTSRNPQGAIMVEVKDSGCGVPVSNLKKLFAHFFTSKPDGLGMGLSISRSIVEAHGGSLDVMNNPEGGATFYFTIPVGTQENT